MTKGGNRKNRAPVYSADTLALRIFFGIALAALGVVIFMAVIMRLGGNVFVGLRNFCFGLAGGASVLLPVLPLWAGILLIWSSQSRAPVRPLLWGSLAYLGLCTFIVLVTRIGNQSLLSYLTQTAGRSWGHVIQEGFRFCMLRGQSGGALGILLGWPLQQILGDVLPAAVVLILTVLSVLMACSLSPKRIRDLATGRIHFRQSREEKAREQAAQEQVAWQQQEQERQRAAQYQAMLQQQQQQAAMAQQQSAMQGSQAYGAPQGYAYPGAQGYNTAAQPYTAPRTGAGPLPDDGGVAEWQQELGNQQAGQTRGRGKKSQILDRPPREQPAESQPGSFMSKIFHRKAESDGLSDASREEKARIQEQVRQVNRSRRPAPEAPQGAAQGQDARAAQGQEAYGGRAAQGQDAPAAYGPGERPEQTAAEAYGRPGAPAEERNDQAYRRPQAPQQTPAENAGQNPASRAESRNGRGRDWNAQLEEAEQKAAAESRRPEGRGQKARDWNAQPEEAAQKAAESRRPEGRGQKARDWNAQLEAAEQAAGGAPGAGRAPAGERPQRESTPVPAVQQKIGEETWKPELNHVSPRSDGEESEDFWTPTPYYAPPLTDLNLPKPNTENTAEEDAMRSRRLEETLESFNVIAHVVHVTHGPAISRFELELAAGTKVSKVAGLEKDIAYGMQATSVRIEAPIPGKSLVGVEVPNRKVSLVTLREVLESPAMQNAKSILTVALGKDIAGTPIVCDLAKMPHMLIAGATGSGKSVCINTIINSLLFRAGPDEVKLILVDPKVVELQVYNNIPHLLIPVVSDPHKAAAALAWAVAEMMDRYDRFARRKVRNLDGYNAVLEEGEKPMPRIVIIIDELADLMMVCKKDVEEYICRLTQLARAAGIHLIVATQRPSVDVITGLIKANIPSRIAFKTASYVDSRTILDRNGSEALLGWGDMLYLPTGSFSPTRIQGCFLSDEEVNKIAADVKRANPSSYDQDILDKLDEMSSDSGETPGMDLIGGPVDTAADGNLFEQAVEFAIADGQISTSTLQRRLKVGYARAGRLTDEMEERGIVSAKDGSKPRKCLITREQWEEMKKSTEGMT